MKRCPSCREVKPLEDFYRLARSKDGHQGYCKVCANRKRNEWAKANPERNDEWNRRSYERLTPERRRAAKLRKEFRMSADDYDVLLIRQGGGCAACRRPPAPGTHLHIDHDHSCCDTRFTCGKCVRGLLCFNCNAALGHVNDSEETLMSLIKYLSKGTPGQCDPVWLKS